MSNLVACRLSSYGKFAHRAWTHLPEIGIRYVEMPVPAAGEMDATRQKLADAGLAASSLETECDVQKPDAVEQMKPQLAACRQLGARIAFLSAKAGDTDMQVIADRLRLIGDAAEACGVTVALETHPDLVTNGDVGRATMETVDHPNIRVNFDTANVHYYNQGVTSTGELGKVIDYVASVHLKDTSGAYKTWDFPALGQGIVDFPAVLAMLSARGFQGPYTIELEGTEGVELDEAGQLKYVADSVAHLRSIGALD